MDNTWMNNAPDTSGTDSYEPAATEENGQDVAQDNGAGRISMEEAYQALRDHYESGGSLAGETDFNKWIMDRGVEFDSVGWHELRETAKAMEAEYVAPPAAPSPPYPPNDSPPPTPEEAAEAAEIDEGSLPKARKI